MPDKEEPNNTYSSDKIGIMQRLTTTFCGLAMTYMVSLSYLVHVLSSLELLGAIFTKVRDGRFTAPPPSFDNHNPLTRSAPSALARKNAVNVIFNKVELKQNKFC